MLRQVRKLYLPGVLLLCEVVVSGFQVSFLDFEGFRVFLTFFKIFL